MRQPPTTPHNRSDRWHALPLLSMTGLEPVIHLDGRVKPCHEEK
jgi:hypothetical protein